MNMVCCDMGAKGLDFPKGIRPFSAGDIYRLHVNGHFRPAVGRRPESSS
jgi:hypothetical protein